MSGIERQTAIGTGGARSLGRANAARIAVSHLSALHLPPAVFVSLAAEAGFGAVGLRLHPAAPGGFNYPLPPGGAEFKETRARLRDAGLRVHDVEFVPLTPAFDLAALSPVLETACELGARRLNVAGDDPDPVRLAATLAAVAEAARPFGLAVDLEFMRWRPVGTLAQAVDAVIRCGAVNAAVLLDTLHLHRSGGTADDVARLRPGLVQSVQICDAPWDDPGDAGIIDEARGGRLPPGRGELPILPVLAQLPAAVDISVEVPMPAHLRDRPLAHLEIIRRAADDLLQPEPRRASA